MTKQEYTRKRLFAGVLIFVSVALITSGIAIWLLFSLLGASTEGGITVAEVAMSPLSFTSLSIDGLEPDEEGRVDASFVFDSLYGDESGRVSWNGETSEKLSITVSGILMGAQHLEKFSYILTLPQGVLDAAEKGYIDISEFYENGEFKEVVVPVAENGVMVSDGTNTAWRFSFRITIKWGDRFKGINPSSYFDMPGYGLHESLETVVEVLQDLRSTVTNNETEVPKYNLTLLAKPNN